MSLVDDDKLKGHVHQDGLHILMEHLVRSDNNLELEDLHGWHHSSLCRNISVKPLVRPANRPALLPVFVVIGHRVQIGPLLNRPLPVGQSREWRNDQEGSSAVFQRKNMV